MRCILHGNGASAKQQVITTSKKASGGETYTLTVNIPTGYGLVSVTNTGDDYNSSWRETTAITVDMIAKTCSITGHNKRTVTKTHGFELLCVSS